MVTINRRGKAWVLNWRQDGTQHRRSLGRITRADAEIQRKAKDLELATGLKFLSSAPVFREFVDEYLSWHESEHPDSHYRIRQIVEDHLIPVFGDTALDMLTPQQVEAYKSGRRGHIRDATLTKELRTLQAVINKAVEWSLLEANPLRRMRAPKILDSKPPHFFTADQLQALYAADPVYAGIWRLLVNTGLRRSEAMALRWEQVSGTALHVLSQKDARTKSGKWRDIPLSSGAKAALNALRGNNDKTGYVLPRIRKESLSRAFSAARNRAGIRDGSLHSLRHTFGTALVQAGVPIRTVQVLMGHSSVTVTERYAHAAPGHLQASVKNLEL